MGIRMPEVPEVTNPRDGAIAFKTNQYTSIRIDDSTTDVRKAWSSAKVQEYAQASNDELVHQFVSNYGPLYFSEYDETMYDEWTDVIKDAIKALKKGDQFFVAWSEKRSAQVVDADSDSEPRMTVIIDGRSFVMSDTGIQEVPIYNIIIQCQDRDSFPEQGVEDRLYIDRDENKLYYWANDVGYVCFSGEVGALHKLTFGADQEYVYDGSKDVTVPVYMGDINRMGLQR